MPGMAAGPSVGGPPPAAAAMAGGGGGNNTLKYVGIGCGVLIALSCLCTGLSWVYNIMMMPH